MFISSQRKSFISLVLVMAVVLLLAAGCSKNGSEDNKAENSSYGSTAAVTEESTEETKPAVDLGGRTIKFGAWFDTTPKAGSSEIGDKLIEVMNDLQQKCNFKMEYINIPYEEYAQKVSASVMAGDPVFDIGHIEDGMFFPGLVTKGYLFPVSDLKEFDFSNPKWNQFTKEASTYSGKVYGFQTEKTYPRTMIYFNKNIFEKEGIPSPYELQRNGQWDWEKMLEIAKKTTKDVNSDGINDQWGLSGIDIAWMFVYSNNGELIRNDDGKPRFGLTEENSLEALQFYQDLAVKHKVFEVNPDGAEWDYAMQQFKDGKTAMFAGAWWMAGSNFKDNMKDDYGVLMFPKGPKADKYISQNYGLNFWCFLNGVKDIEKIAAVWNEYTEPIEGFEEAWKNDYSYACRDEESIKTFELMYSDENIFKHNPLKFYRELETTWYDVAWNLEHGTSTAKERINAISQQAQSLIDDALKSQGETEAK